MTSSVEVAPRLVAGDPKERINWSLSIPFFILHLLPLGALWFHPTWIDWAVCFGLYGARMFFITGVYHRYFAHRGYKAGRVMTFLMAFGGGTRSEEHTSELQSQSNLVCRLLLEKKKKKKKIQRVKKNKR